MPIREPVFDRAIDEGNDNGENREDRQGRRVQPGRQQSPAAGRDSLRVDLQQIDERGDEEGPEPEPRRELNSNARRAPRDRRPVRSEQSARGARNRAGFDETPRDTRQHQGDGDLHDGEQDRVVLGAGVWRLDMAAEVEPLRQATTGELSYERKQKKREPRETTLVTPCTVHPHQ